TRALGNLLYRGAGALDGFVIGVDSHKRPLLSELREDGAEVPRPAQGGVHHGVASLYVERVDGFFEEDGIVARFHTAMRALAPRAPPRTNPHRARYPSCTPPRRPRPRAPRGPTPPRRRTCPRGRRTT